MTIEQSVLRTGIAGTWRAFRGDVRRWLGWRGVFHLVVWLVAIEWILYLSVVTKAQPSGGLGFESLMNLLAVLPPVAGIVLTAAAVCGSYHDGTTAWVLGKPVPRAGHVAATVGGLWLGLATTAIVIPGLVAYWWLPKVKPYRFVIPGRPPIGRFVAALGVMSLVLLFFVALAAMLSVVIRRRSVVAVIAVWALLMLRVPLGYPGWYDYLPARLIRTDLAQGGWPPATEFIYGAPFDAMQAVLGSAGLAAVFLLGAMAVFRRLDL